MKREFKLRVIIDSDNDQFLMNSDYRGFDEKTPLQNSLLVASILEIARKQELEKFPLKVEE